MPVCGRRENRIKTEEDVRKERESTWSTVVCGYGSSGVEVHAEVEVKG